jgi:hypothetical protein
MRKNIAARPMWIYTIIGYLSINACLSVYRQSQWEATKQRWAAEDAARRSELDRILADDSIARAAKKLDRWTHGGKYIEYVDPRTRKSKRVAIR